MLALYDGNFPSDLAAGDREAIEEERRLLYVALTRAQRDLHLYVPLRYYHRPRGVDDGHGYGKASRFLTEEVQSLCRRTDRTGLDVDPAGEVIAARAEPAHRGLGRRAVPLSRRLLTRSLTPGSSVARLPAGGTSFATYAGRRLLAVVAVVVITPSLTFVVLGALHNGVAVLEQARQLPGYLDDTFLHLSLGDAPPVFQKSLHDLVLDGLPVDVALLVGGMLLGVAIGLATGLASGARRRSGIDRALSVGSALALSAPVYWFGFIVPHALRAAVGLPASRSRSCAGTAATSRSARTRCAGCSRCGSRGSCSPRRSPRCATA